MSHNKSDAMPPTTPLPPSTATDDSFGRVPGRDVVLNCGWGRLIFGQTFSQNEKLAKILCSEAENQRDIAFYMRDPHVVISLAPHEIFLDPSHTYRLWLDRYRPAAKSPLGFQVRFVATKEDCQQIHELYIKRGMISPTAEFVWHHRDSRDMTYLIAVDEDNEVIGVVMGVDHYEMFADPENGSSLWALAVDAQTPRQGVGETLVRALAEYYFARRRAFMDLSVMHDNEQAITLYEKLGFRRVIVFALKHKNSYNEPLFIAPSPQEGKLNPYAEIIIKEARRRGIAVQVLDSDAGYFELSFGGRNIVCRESLSELTTAIAMSRCDDKAVTRRLLDSNALHVPAQQTYRDSAQARQFLLDYKRVVVKPARGEQGAGISVDVQTSDDLKLAIEHAQYYSDKVLLEEYIVGNDLRIVVIDFKVVAAATRCPAKIIGNGRDTVTKLIEKQSRRRAAATGGESQIPLDNETKRCVREAGYQLDSVLPANVELQVRKTANLHTGGTIHDVTDNISSTLREAAVNAAIALNIPVVGFDFIVSNLKGDDYVIIEANERPGLANHEPQPIAERFIDLLFPQTVTREV